MGRSVSMPPFQFTSRLQSRVGLCCWPKGWDGLESASLALGQPAQLGGREAELGAVPALPKHTAEPALEYSADENQV